MVSFQSDVPGLEDIVGALRRDLDRLQRGEDVVPPEPTADDLSFPDLESPRLVQDLGRGLETGQQRVRKKREEGLRTQGESQIQVLKQRIQQLETSEKKRRQEITTPTEGKFVVAGRVLDAETREALPGIRVQGMERDPENDDVLGEVRTDREGFYRLEYTEEHFHAAQDEEPETYIRVLDEEGNALFTSDQSYRHKAGEVEVINAAIEGSKVSERRELGKQIRENTQAELNELRRRREDLKNRLHLRADPLSILPPEGQGDGDTTEGN